MVGIIIKIRDDKELLRAILLKLLKRTTNFVGMQKENLVMLKEFSSAPSEKRKWACLCLELRMPSQKKQLETKNMVFKMENNWGRQVGEEYIFPTHWIFLEGEDVDLLLRLI